MSVYVDTLINFNNPNAPKCFKNKPSCHMYADLLDELHEMALKIGMKKSWFQEHRWINHYDLTEGRRKKAVELGAIEQDRKQAVATWRRLRGIK